MSRTFGGLNMSELPTNPEDRLAWQWNRCVNDALTKLGVAAAFGYLVKTFVTKRKSWPLVIAMGGALGMAWQNCEHDMRLMMTTCIDAKPCPEREPEDEKGYLEWIKEEELEKLKDPCEILRRMRGAKAEKKAEESKEAGKNGKEEGKNGKEEVKNGKEEGKNGKEEGKNGKEEGRNGKEEGKNGKEEGKNGKEEGKNGKEEGKNGKEEKKENEAVTKEKGD